MRVLGNPHRALLGSAPDTSLEAWRPHALGRIVPPVKPISPWPHPGQRSNPGSRGAGAPPSRAQQRTNGRETGLRLLPAILHRTPRCRLQSRSFPPVLRPGLPEVRFGQLVLPISQNQLSPSLKQHDAGGDHGRQRGKLGKSILSCA